MERKCFCKILIMLLILLNFSTVPITVSGAFESNDTAVITMSEEEERKYLDVFSLKVLDKSNGIQRLENHFFFSFDISENEKIALLFDDASVAVFDSDGRVENILKFDEDILNTRSRSAAIKWNGENLELMLGYDISCLFSTDGDVLDVWQYQTQLTNIPNPSEITSSEYTYKMNSSNLFVRFTGGGNYDKLLRISANGKEKILFETKKDIPDEAILLIVFIAVFNITVGGVLISIFISKKATQNVKHNYSIMSQGHVPGTDR